MKRLALLSLTAAFTLSLTLFSVRPLFAAATATTGAEENGLGKEMEVSIKGTFKGRLLVKNIVAPVTMNLEKLQDFPEDPAQQILLAPLPTSQSSEFNARSEIKGHAPFWPWIPPLAEPPFLRIVPPKNVQIISWMFEVLNPEGRTIYRQRSTHELPDELLWDGKDSEMQFAVVNRLYAAQLTLMTPDEKVMVIPGESIILPALAYSSENSQTVELSLDRLFNKGTAEISPEGALMINKVCESMRERGLRSVHVRIAQKAKDLAVLRENALAGAMRKTLRLPDTAVEHDHVDDISRGEIAALWLKLGNAQ